jgi:F-type H+-transporting ATPase subunit b
VVELSRELKELLIARQETAQLEAKAFELEQSTALAAEAKAVLDSWVRYEGQVKIRQQKELSETIIAKIQKELETPKILQQILQQSVADVESKNSQHKIVGIIANAIHRDRCIQSTIDGEKIQERTDFLYHPCCL